MFEKKFSSKTKFRFTHKSRLLFKLQTSSFIFSFDNFQDKTKIIRKMSTKVLNKQEVGHVRKLVKSNI